MISISSIQFDNEGWELVENKFDEICWRNNDDPSIITLHYFSKRPDIPCSLEQIDDLRNAYREAISQSGGGLISLEVFLVKKLKCLELICKVPQQPHGMCYFASLTFPFADFSFVVKLECPELGMTGFREAVISSELMKSGQVRLNAENGSIEGWARDPYDANYNGPALRNLAEDEKYDADFPAHPLSRARRLLAGIKMSLNPSEDLLGARQFDGAR